MRPGQCSQGDLAIVAEPVRDLVTGQCSWASGHQMPRGVQGPQLDRRREELLASPGRKTHLMELVYKSYPQNKLL